MLQLYARCQCLPENGSCRWKVVVVVVSRQRLVTETWKALTWSTNRHSSASHAQTRLPHLNHTSVGGECACLCVSARVYHLNVLPFIDLKTRGFCAPVKPHVEVAARFIRSLHLSTVPPFFFFPPHFSSLVVWYQFTGSPDFPESPRGHVAHLLTSLPLELREISPDIGLGLPAVTLTSHLLKTESKRSRRCAI